ncbi:hypothetical protein [Actinokineospora bangkokensis]|nr:hypothetical protein [Actinokineospora bangkokensis]
MAPAPARAEQDPTWPIPVPHEPLDPVPGGAPLDGSLASGGDAVLVWIG